MFYFNLSLHEPTNLIRENNEKITLYCTQFCLQDQKSQYKHHISQKIIISGYGDWIFFFENRAPSHFWYYHFASLCQNSENSYGPIPNERTNVQLKSRVIELRHQNSDNSELVARFVTSQHITRFCNPVL